MNRKQARKASATAELAVCLPLIVFLILGGMEASNGVFVKQGLTISAYETAKLATTVGFTPAQAEARGQQILDAREITGGAIDINPPDVTSQAPGTAITVTVTAPAATNAVSPILFTGDTLVTARIVMNRN